MKNIYVASSWRGPHHGAVVDALRAWGYCVYDYRTSGQAGAGFHWSDVDQDWQNSQPEKFRRMLRHPIAVVHYLDDFRALRSAHATVLVLPSGRSSHLELGFAIGAGQITGILMLEKSEPELAYKAADFIALSIGEMLTELAERLGKGEKS
jgi:hypothetical protein